MRAYVYLFFISQVQAISSTVGNSALALDVQGTDKRRLFHCHRYLEVPGSVRAKVDFSIGTGIPML